MTRLQFKITCQQEPPGENSWELHVWEREVIDDVPEAKWHHLHARRVYVDPRMYTGGRRLRLLLSSLS